VTRSPPTLDKLLKQSLDGASKPPAFVLAGHNGSGKSTLWYQRLASKLRIPLINADRLTLSILPDPDPGTGRLPAWAQDLRDDDVRWQRLSQQAVRAMKNLVMAEAMPFAFETVFSHWKPRPGGGPRRTTYARCNGPATSWCCCSWASRRRSCPSRVC